MIRTIVTALLLATICTAAYADTAAKLREAYDHANELIIEVDEGLIRRSEGLICYRSAHYPQLIGTTLAAMQDALALSDTAIRNMETARPDVAVVVAEITVEFGPLRSSLHTLLEEIETGGLPQCPPTH